MRKTKLHYHDGIETIAYLLAGGCAVFYGDALECRVDLRAGEKKHAAC
jgi:uncharacterized RmlC-like cupin family protein